VEKIQNFLTLKSVAHMSIAATVKSVAHMPVVAPVKSVAHMPMVAPGGGVEYRRRGGPLRGAAHPTLSLLEARALYPLQWLL
jgi:hypothetical protein